MYGSTKGKERERAVKVRQVGSWRELCKEEMRALWKGAVLDMHVVCHSGMEKVMKMCMRSLVLV